MDDGILRHHDVIALSTPHCRPETVNDRKMRAIAKACVRDRARNGCDYNAPHT